MVDYRDITQGRQGKSILHPKNSQAHVHDRDEQRHKRIRFLYKTEPGVPTDNNRKRVKKIVQREYRERE